MMRSCPPRRGLLRAAASAGAAGLAGLLAGCGFRPLYGPLPAAPEEGPEEFRRELAAIRVGLIPDRFGQVLRRDLQRRFEGLAPGTPARYLLAVAVQFDTEILGYRRDGTISRVRQIAVADWNLTTQAVPPQLVARSERPIRVLDAFNVPDLQFFAADTAREAMEQRLIERLGNEIARGVSLELRRRVEGRAAQAGGDPERDRPTPG